MAASLELYKICSSVKGLSPLYRCGAARSLHCSAPVLCQKNSDGDGESNAENSNVNPVLRNAAKEVASSWGDSDSGSDIYSDLMSQLDKVENVVSRRTDRPVRNKVDISDMQNPLANPKNSEKVKQRIETIKSRYMVNKAQQPPVTADKQQAPDTTNESPKPLVHKDQPASMIRMLRQEWEQSTKQQQKQRDSVSQKTESILNNTLKQNREQSANYTAHQRQPQSGTSIIDEILKGSRAKRASQMQHPQANRADSNEETDVTAQNEEKSPPDTVSLVKSLLTKSQSGPVTTSDVQNGIPSPSVASQSLASLLIKELGQNKSTTELISKTRIKEENLPDLKGQGLLTDTKAAKNRPAEAVNSLIRKAVAERSSEDKRVNIQTSKRTPASRKLERKAKPTQKQQVSSNQRSLLQELMPESYSKAMFEADMAFSDPDIDARAVVNGDDDVDYFPQQQRDGLQHYKRDGSIANAMANDQFIKMFNDGSPMNVFNPSKWTSRQPSETSPLPVAWISSLDKQLKDVRYCPTNGFEEMCRMTERRQLWQFPIDNEQGMEEERNVPFYEHVFLDKHLAPFPKDGPVRQFMQLVTLGLSKNPHLTVQEKLHHIKWFVEYFEKKQPLITADQLLSESRV